MNIQKEGYPLLVSNRLITILTKENEKAGISGDTGIIINFRDTSYSPEDGGFHPVEIAIAPDGKIRYLTDFAYVGRPPMAELAKDLDFDFEEGWFQQFNTRYTFDLGQGLYRVWQSNFCAYYEANAFDQIRVQQGS